MFPCPECGEPVGEGTKWNALDHVRACLHIPPGELPTLLRQYERVAPGQDVGHSDRVYVALQMVVKDRESAVHQGEENGGTA